MVKELQRLLVMLVTLLLMVSVTVGAQENVQKAKLGLDQVLKLALNENLDLKMAEIQLNNAKLDYKKNELGNLLTNSRYVKMQGELALINAQDNFQQTKNQVITNIINQYLKIIKFKQEIETGEKEVELAQRKLQEIKAQVDVGYKGSLDLFDQRNEYQSALIELETTKDDQVQLLTQFKTQIGVSRDRVVYIPELIRPEIWEIEETEAIESALQKNRILTVKEKQIDLAEFDLARAEVAATPELELQKLKNNLKLARLNYTKEKQQQEYSVQSKFFAFKQAVKQLELVEQNLSKSQEEYKIIQEQQAAGLVTKNDLLAAEVNMLKAKENYLGIIINYYLGQLNLQQSMGLEVGVNLNVSQEKK